MLWFALASLSPVVVLTAACLLGGAWGFVAWAFVTVFVLAIDRLTRVRLPMREDDATLRAGRVLSTALAVVHFPLLALGVWALSGHAALGPVQGVALGLGLGTYFGQVSNSNAHELIHSAARWPRRLGIAVFSSLLFGHHASAHPLVHHVWVASDQDPNSARKGESFYRFWPRAWIGSFRAGLAAENRRRQATGRAWLSHPYLAYGLGSALSVVLAGIIGGWRGVLVLIALAVFAQMQLMVSDYIQHYGLRRRIGPNGRPEPVGPQHSWNAAPWYSVAMMLNAPLHSDHHAHPARPFPALRLDRDTMPMLPYSFPLMGAIAMVPSLWRRIMDRRVARWCPATGADGTDLSDSTHVAINPDSSDPDGIAPLRANSDGG
ncbi:alkane 1-monooxygenase [Arenibacterium sp. CAU 1754]